MYRSLLSCLLLLALAAEVSAQTTQQTTRRSTSKPGQTTVHKTSTKKVGMASPAARPGAVVRRQETAASDPASNKGQGVYAAPGEPVDVQGRATMGYDGAAPRRAKAKPATTLTPR